MKHAQAITAVLRGLYITFTDKGSLSPFSQKSLDSLTKPI